MLLDEETCLLNLSPFSISSRGENRHTARIHREEKSKAERGRERNREREKEREREGETDRERHTHTHTHTHTQKHTVLVLVSIVHRSGVVAEYSPAPISPNKCEDIDIPAPTKGFVHRSTEQRNLETGREVLSLYIALLSSHKMAKLSI